jgi:acetyltransferase-like isoleucine patch superfamily enzyme
VPGLLLHRLRARGRLVVDGRARVGRRLRLDLEPGALVRLGDGARLGAGCRLHVGAGAVVSVGPGARLGERCVLVARERIDVGAGAVLGAEVVIVDFDHDLADVECPVRVQGLRTAPVRIGEGARVDDAAGVLRGVTVGDGAHVGVRSVVTRDVAAGADVGGVPARPLIAGP